MSKRAEHAGHANGAPSSTFERHKRFWIALVFLTALALPLLALEIGLRVVDAYDPFDLIFYTVSRVEDGEGGTVLTTPYGPVRINSMGYPDVEFDLSDPRERVGYIGDSVIYGLGVGHGYRVTDHIREEVSEYQHFTVGESGAGVPTPDRADRLIAELGLSRFVYFFNLNDVQPTPLRNAPAVAPLPRQSVLQRIRDSWLFSLVDQLRLHSRVYNMVRVSVRNAMMKLGYDAIQGAPAYELRPDRYREVVGQTAARINALADAVGARGVRFCVVMLPYEMQISAEAERYYRESGIEWEPGFVERSTQAMLRSSLDSEIEVLDAYHAFVRPGHVAEDRQANRLGQYYINRAGGALDWNHPNRSGHSRLADYVLNEGPCGL